MFLHYLVIKSMFSILNVVIKSDRLHLIYTDWLGLLYLSRTMSRWRTSAHPQIHSRSIVHHLCLWSTSPRPRDHYLLRTIPKTHWFHILCSHFRGKCRFLHLVQGSWLSSGTIPCLDTEHGLLCIQNSEVDNICNILYFTSGKVEAPTENGWRVHFHWVMV